MSRIALGSREPPSPFGGLGLEARAASVFGVDAARGLAFAFLRPLRGRDRSVREPEPRSEPEPLPRVPRLRPGATRRDDPARPRLELGRRRVVEAPESPPPLPPAGARAPADPRDEGRDLGRSRGLRVTPSRRSLTGLGARFVIRSTAPPMRSTAPLAFSALTFGSSRAAAGVADTAAMAATAANATSARAPVLKARSTSADREPPPSPASETRAWGRIRTDRGRGPLGEVAILRNAAP